MSMNPIEKERMLKYILTTIKEKKITVYAIAKDTNLKQTTLHSMDVRKIHMKIMSY